MSKATATSFQVLLNGDAREIFRVIESKNNGDLRLIERHTGWHAEALGGRISKVSENRFSIHVTPNNPSFSLIKQTFRSDHFNRDRPIWTDAIKSKTGFIFVLHKICQDLSPEVFRPNEKTTPVVLGTYDPTMYTLQFSILVGPPDREFRYYRHNHFYVQQRVFDNFRIVIFLSFIPLASQRISYTNYRVTLRDDPTLDLLTSQTIRELWKGRDEKRCVEEYLHWRAVTRDTFLQGIQSSGKFYSAIAQFLTWASVNSLEAHEHRKKMFLFAALNPIEVPHNATS